MSDTLRRYASIAVLSGVLLSGCSSTAVPADSTQSESSEDVRASASVIFEEYFTAVLHGDGDEISEQIINAVSTLSDEDRNALQAVGDDPSAKIDPDTARRIARAVEGIDPAEKLYSTEGLSDEESAVLPFVSSAISSSVRQATKVDTPEISFEHSSLKKSKDGSVSLLMSAVSVESDGEDVSAKVVDVFPEELSAVRSGEKWLIDARPLIDFFFAGAD